MVQSKENKLREVRIEKVVLNIAMHPEPDEVKKAVALLETISGRKAVTTHARKRIAGWGIRPGVPIGAKVTVRGKETIELLKRLLEAVDFKLGEGQFTDNGFSFGIKEYIDITGAKYDPKLGMMGLQASVTLGRPGYRVKHRRTRPGKIGKRHTVTKEDAIRYASDVLKVKVGGKE